MTTSNFVCPRSRLPLLRPLHLRRSTPLLPNKIKQIMNHACWLLSAICLQYLGNPWCGPWWVNFFWWLHFMSSLVTWDNFYPLEGSEPPKEAVGHPSCFQTHPHRASTCAWTFPIAITPAAPAAATATPVNCVVAHHSWIHSGRACARSQTRKNSWTLRTVKSVNNAKVLFSKTGWCVIASCDRCGCYRSSYRSCCNCLPETWHGPLGGNKNQIIARGAEKIEEIVKLTLC